MHRLIRIPRSAAIGIATIAVAALAASGASATPKEEIAQKRQEAQAAQAQIEQLGMELEPAIEAYNQSLAELEDVRARVTENKRRIGLIKQNITSAQTLLADRLASAYRAGDTDAITAILSAGSIEEMLQTADYIRRSQEDLADLLATLADGRRDLQRREKQLERDEKRQAELTAQAEEERKRIESSLAQQQELLSGLEGQIAQLQKEEAARQRRLAEEARKRLAEERRRAREAAARNPEPDFGGSAGGGSGDTGGGGSGGDSGGSGGGGGGDNGGSGGGGGDDSVPPPPPTDGSLGARAVAVAMRYLGVPYVWGGSSPSGFDCSGLTMYAYAQVGISLSHFTGAQWNEGTHVSYDELIPGDLVFYYSDLHHMGMYIGGGQMIHAPHTGDVVKIEDMSPGSWRYGNFAGGVRPY